MHDPKALQIVAEQTMQDRRKAAMEQRQLKRTASKLKSDNLMADLRRNLAKLSKQITEREQITRRQARREAN